MKFNYIGEIVVSNNDVFIMKRIGDNMYQSIRDDVLSDAYNRDGQRGLDRAVIEQMWETTVLEGNHPSIERYKKAFWNSKAIQAEGEYHETVSGAIRKYNEAAYNALNSRSNSDKIDIAEVEAIRKTARDKFFDAVVKCLPET